MGCGCSSGTSTDTNQVVNTANRVVTSPENCFFDKDILLQYKNIVEIIKNNDLYSTVGMTIQQSNSYLGIIQSALNYPDNYCLYESQLTTFKDTILPNLLIHVAEYL